MSVFVQANRLFADAVLSDAVWAPSADTSPAVLQDQPFSVLGSCWNGRWAVPQTSRDLEALWGSSFISGKAFGVTARCPEAPASISLTSDPSTVRSRPHLRLWIMPLFWAFSEVISHPELLEKPSVVKAFKSWPPLVSQSLSRFLALPLSALQGETGATVSTL